MSEVNNKYQERTYFSHDSCVFRKTKESFGGLSNMATGFPIIVNDIRFYSSEALYQVCRFPHLPEVQSKIISEHSPMSAKMVSKPFRNDSRSDWDSVRIEIMYWCLRVKLAQNFISFGQLLESTYNRAIVEDSSKDAFWGAIRDKKDSKMLVGVNALGRLLMKLRQEYNSPNRFSLLYVPVLSIPNFHIFNKPVGEIDECNSFVSHINHILGKPKIKQAYKRIADAPFVAHRQYQVEKAIQSFVAEPVFEISFKEKTKKQTTSKKKITTPKKQVKKKAEVQQELPMSH